MYMSNTTLSATSGSADDSVEGDPKDGIQPPRPTSDSSLGCPKPHGVECCGQEWECPPFASVDMSIESNRASLASRGCPIVNGQECCGQSWECQRLWKPKAPLSCPIVNGVPCCGQSWECGQGIAADQKPIAVNQKSASADSEALKLCGPWGCIAA
jgi:hypothetical protein